MNLQTRVVNILARPQTEWPVIAAESDAVATLYKEYIAVLAAIPPLAAFVGMTVVGVPVPMFGRIRVGVVSGLTNTIVQYVLALVGAYVAALVIDKLAPTFQSKSNTIQALKLVAYAATPAWIAGVFGIIPALSPLMILGGLYGIYLFYLGLTPLMHTPQEKVIPYMLVSAVVIIVVMIVAGLLTTAIAGTRIGPTL